MMRPSTRPRPSPEDQDDPFDFPDLPDSFSDQNTSSATSLQLPRRSEGGHGSGVGAIKNLSSTIMGAGPNGIGVITKLNSKAKPSTISKGSIKLKNKAVARAWEDELDFNDDNGDGDGVGGWKGKLSLAKGLGNKGKSTPGPDALDDLDMDDGDEDEGDWRKMVQNKASAGKGSVGITKLGLGLPRKQLNMPEADALDDLGFDLDDEDEGGGGGGKAGDTLGKKAMGTIKLNAIKPGGGLVFALPPKREMPGADALDDLDAFDDDFGDINEDEATLKAGATLKALLPPPRIRTPPTDLPTSPTEDNEDELDDADFALPLNLTNLTLATRTSSHTGRPRSSIASNNTDWNSPTTSTSTSTGKKTDGWDSTPSKRFSETSNTSVSDGVASHAKDKYRVGGGEGDSSSKLDEDEDMEEGLILPSKRFFKSTSKRELNSLLDRKRRPEYGPRPGSADAGAGGYASPTRSSAFHDLTLHSEGLEDGLVFEDPKAELTRKRLTKSKEARSLIPIPTRRSPTGRGRDSNSIFGRDSPFKQSAYSIRERTQSNVGLTGHRSHSTGNSTIMPSGNSDPNIVGTSGSGSGFKPFSPTRPRSPTHFSPVNASAGGKERSRSGQAFIPMRIPKTPSKSSSSSGLRHQKSSSHLPSPSTHAPPTPGLARKQSLASLQDVAAPSSSAFSSVSSLGNHPLHSLAEEPAKNTATAYATSSSSRLTNPTSASKAKARPPLSGVFPHGPANAGSSSSSSTRSRLLHAQMKRRPYGDGTELEAIADLEVDEGDKKDSWPRGGGAGSEKGSSRSKGSTRDRPSLRSVFSPENKEKSSSSKGLDQARDKDKGKEKEKEKEGSWGRRKGKRAPLLIKHLGTVDKRKVVGEMTWNPTALRWEGNESALHDFDHVQMPSGARPALIPHSAPDSPTSNSHHTAAGTVRIVGNMQFDPKEMKWISLDPDDEVDPFEGMADDEDEEGGKGGTIRASASAFARFRPSSTTSGSTTESSSVRYISGVSSFHDRDHDHGRDHGHLGGEVTDALRLECKEAEERHRREMRGWQSGTGGSWSRSEERREEKRLWEIRHLAQVVG